MISANGINEEEFVSAIKDLNRSLAQNKNLNKTNIVRRKPDKKHKIICSVSRWGLEITFLRKGDEFFKIIRNGSDVCNGTTYYAMKKPYPDPNYREDRESWFGSCAKTCYHCSREQFYEYCKEYPPFFEWLLWNQI